MCTFIQFKMVLLRYFKLKERSNLLPTHVKAKELTQVNNIFKKTLEDIMLQIKLPDVKIASCCFSSISPNIIPANVSSSMVFIL